MRRRDFVKAATGTLAYPFAVLAQPSEMPVIGYLSGLSAGDRPGLLEAFHLGLGVSGYAVGRNAAIEYRYGDNKPDRLPALVSDLIARRVSVIVATGGNNPGLVAKSMTSTIPIVFTSGFDPVRAGLVKSLGHPEANVTGVSWFAAEIGQKHLELARELVPQVSHVALLLNRNNPEAAIYEQSVREGARAFDLTLSAFDGRTADEIDEAFGKVARQKFGVFLIGGDPYLTSRASQIVLLAARYAIPTIYVNREFTQAGGLISYGNSISDAYRRAGIYTGRILKGDKPPNLPIDRATKFELVVNMRTAKALGLEMPLSLLMRIDEVID